jgi:hypothetical protein
MPLKKGPRQLGASPRLPGHIFRWHPKRSSRYFLFIFDHPLFPSGWSVMLFGLRPSRCSLSLVAARHSKEFYTKNGVWWVFPTALKLVCMNISFISNYNETVFRNVLAIALANPRGVHQIMAVRRA